MAIGILEETLKCIQRERPSGFDLSFNYVDQLLKSYGEHNLAKRLYEDIPFDWDWQVVADLFGILIWSTSDNGHALTQETERWLLTETDPRKILIALNLDVYPFIEKGEMEQVLTQVANRFPEAAAQCHSLIEQRRRSNE